MNKKRVDIEVSIETLAWAASEATKLGISRRQFLSYIIRTTKLLIDSGAVDLDPFKQNK